MLIGFFFFFNTEAYFYMTAVEIEICLLCSIYCKFKTRLARSGKILLATTSALLEFNFIYRFQKFEFYFGNLLFYLQKTIRL